MDTHVGHCQMPPLPEKSIIAPWLAGPMSCLGMMCNSLPNISSHNNFPLAKYIKKRPREQQNFIPSCPPRRSLFGVERGKETILKWKGCKLTNCLLHKGFSGPRYRAEERSLLLAVAKVHSNRRKTMDFKIELRPLELFVIATAPSNVFSTNLAESGSRNARGLK